MGLFSLFLSSVLTFVTLNCENLFDFRHDSLKADVEFTPEGSRKWTERKFWDKLENTAKSIIACGDDGTDWRLPGLVALCEVENDSVMHYLTKRSLLRGAKYEYIVTDSPDERGVDVALMYSYGSFAPIDHYPLRVKTLRGMRPTRDILYVSGRIVTGDTLHIFVVHAPSRHGGTKRTDKHRALVAERLCAAIDSIRTVNEEPNIIVAGDFNDSADGPLLTALYACGLDNVSKDACGDNGAAGTYKYKGKWESVDHILVSGKMASNLQSCKVYDAPFLLEDDEKYGGVQPFRTYRAWRYRNGYSDHLPLVARFVLK